MLAPTQEQVRDLNSRVQFARATLTGTGVLLADGLSGFVGDTVITRTNDRCLRTTGQDWVRNGDRWTITGTADDGGLTLQHLRSRHQVTLPAEYVRNSVELGYATTTHAAQGVTADTVHGLVTSAQTRQGLYTMLTRGRYANHAYVPADATTGDPHSLISPGAVHPRTATETLTTVLANDGAADSATTHLATVRDPVVLRRTAADRYADTLRLAGEHVIGPTAVHDLETHAAELLTGLEDQPAWPTLRARLIEAAADGLDAHELLTDAVEVGRLGDARDPAALVEWRIRLATGPGDTDDARGVSRLVSEHPAWGPHLDALGMAVTPQTPTSIAQVPRPARPEDMWRPAPNSRDRGQPSW